MRMVLKIPVTEEAKVVAISGVIQPRTRKRKQDCRLRVVVWRYRAEGSRWRRNAPGRSDLTAGFRARLGMSAWDPTTYCSTGSRSRKSWGSPRSRSANGGGEQGA